MRRTLWIVLLTAVLFSLATSPMLAVGPGYGVRDNGSFETGGLRPWLGALDAIGFRVFKVGEEPAELGFGLTPSHGQYVALARCARPFAAAEAELVSLLEVPEGVPGEWHPGLAFEYRAVSQTPKPTGVQDRDPGNYVSLSAQILPVKHRSPDAQLDLMPLVNTLVYTSSVGAGMDTGNVTAVVDLGTQAGEEVLLLLKWASLNETGQEVWGQIDNVRLVQISDKQSQRADVSVIIYGGWDGLPVDAWVGGTAQPRMTTAINGYGEQQAMWSFWPAPGASWSVNVQPSLPAGLDPAQWEYRLVRVDCPTMGWSNGAPGSGSVLVLPGQQYVITYQLVHKG
ncbi:MAG: hypothetical protein ACYC4R_01030 [Anaerolineae bacterium]